MKKLSIGLIALSMIATTKLTSAQTEQPADSSTQNVTAVGNAETHVGWFEAEGKKVDVRFVRVIWAAEGSEKEGESNSVKQLVFDSKDPQGKAVKVYRYQITAKNTGYEEVQYDKEADYKMKSVTEGVKLHIEVPLNAAGQPEFDKAYLGNVAYNFGTKENSQKLSGATIDQVKFNIHRIELPSFGSEHKPGDKGMIYNEGYLDFTFSSKAKRIADDQFIDFNIHVKGPITLTHVRGKEREANAVSIDPAVVAKNVK